MEELYPQLLAWVNGLWRRRWIALALSWILCLVGWGVVSTLPDTYSSSGRVYVDTATVLRPLLSGIAVEDDVYSEINVMKRTLLSRPNLEKVARATDLDITATSDEAMERLIQRLRRSTRVAGAGDNLFAISFEGPDPQQAKDIVQALITIFIERNLGDNRTDMDAARQFLDQQIRSYELQLEEAEQRTARFKQQNMGLLPGASGYHGRLSGARERLARAQSDLKEATTQRDVLRRELAEVPEFLEFQSDQALNGAGPPSTTEIRIIELEGRLEDLLTEYTDQHPDVVKVQRRLDAMLEKQELELQAALGGNALTGDAENGTKTLKTVNPLHDQLRVRLIEQEANVQVLQEAVREREQVVADLNALATSVPIVEAEYTKLNRDYGVLQRKYQELLSRREAARISQDRENQADKVQFRIIDPPQVAVYPSGPNRAAFLMVATVVSVGAGVGFAFLLTLISPTFANARQLSDQFGIPVIGVVQEVHRAWRRPVRFANAMGFFSVFLCLPALLGILLHIESQYGIGRLQLAQLTDERMLTELAINVTEISRDMVTRLFNKLL